MLELQILSGVLLTSILSGIIGMGGGLILMGLYTFLLPVKSAMILHGVTQFSSNGFRGFLHKEHIQWKILKPYFFGALIVFCLLRYFEFVPSKAFVLILSGSFTFISFIPFIANKLDILKKGRAFVCGGIVTLAQILAGASGGTLDIFYVNSSLDRHKVIASKAMTQTFGHFVKLIYYLSLASVGTSIQNLDWWIYPGVALTAFLGTRIGKVALDRLSENNFRKYSKILILLIGLSLIWRGFILLTASDQNKPVSKTSKLNVFEVEKNKHPTKRIKKTENAFKVIQHAKKEHKNCILSLFEEAKGNLFFERNKDELNLLVGDWFYKNKKIESIEPQSNQDLFLLGLAHAGMLDGFKSKNIDLEKAHDFLLESARNDPTNAAPWVFLAQLQDKFGDEELKKEFLEKANKADHFSTYTLNFTQHLNGLAKSPEDLVEIVQVLFELPIPDYISLKNLISNNNLEHIALLMMEDGLNPDNKIDFLNWVAIEYAIGKLAFDKIMGSNTYPSFKELIKTKNENLSKDNRFKVFDKALTEECTIEHLSNSLRF